MESWREELYHSATFAGDNWRNELCHFGIFGQKHGLRRFQNYDGSLTPEGRKRYGVGDPRKPKPVSESTKDGIRKLIHDSRFDDDISERVVRIVGGDVKKLNDAKQALQKFEATNNEIAKEEEAMFREINRGGKLKEQYEAVSEIAAYGDNFGMKVKDMTMERVAWMAYMGIFEDGQQSNCNAYSMYADEHNLVDKASELDSKRSASYKETTAACKQAFENAAGSVANESVNKNNLSAASISTMVANQMVNAHDKTTSGYRVSEAADASRFSDHTRECIKEAKEIASKLSNSTDKNNWYYLNEAVEALGLENVKSGDLSDADWNRINAKIADLRK